MLTGGIVAVPASAGVQAPHDMIATPNTGPVGTNVVISNAENSPCGGQEGDVPAEVALIIIRPDDTEVDLTVPTDDATGNWSVGYTNTDLVGTYTVEGDCLDQQQVPNVRVNATGFAYTDLTFEITAQVPTTTATPTTTAPPAPAVAATAAFTG